MFDRVKEVHVGKVAWRRDQTLYSYFIVPEPSAGRRNRFNLFRINQDMTSIKRMGVELTLTHCRQIIRDREPRGTRRVSHNSV